MRALALWSAMDRATPDSVTLTQTPTADILTVPAPPPEDVDTWRALIKAFDSADAWGSDQVDEEPATVWAAITTRT